VECDLGHVRGADLATVGALARAAVNTRRTGARLRVVNVSPELRDLIALAGLRGVLLGRDGRQAEEGEQPLGVEERREPDDPPL
jgi:anti-anti-sigma regulatory factor